MREFSATQWAIEMNPSIKGTLLLIRTTTGPFIMASAFLYEYLRLGSTARRPGLIRYYGDQFAADGDKAADDYDSLDYETEEMMKRKIFDSTEGWRSK